MPAMFSALDVFILCGASLLFTGVFALAVRFPAMLVRNYTLTKALSLVGFSFSGMGGLIVLTAFAKLSKLPL